MKSFSEILKAKREYYGETEAAIEFAAEEYALTKYKEWNNVRLISSVTLSLENFKPFGFREGVGVFGGEPEFDQSLLYFEERYHQVVIEIPEYTNSILPGYLEKLLFEVIKKIGVEQFKERFKFISLGRYDCEGSLESTFSRIRTRLKFENQEEVQIEESPGFKLNKPFSSLFIPNRKELSVVEVWLLAFKDPAWLFLWVINITLLFLFLFKLI